MIDSKLVYMFLVIIAGIVVTFQGPINGGLAKTTSVDFATLLSFLLGTILMGIIYFAKGTEIPSINSLKSIPWYYYLGGITGLIYVMLVIISIQPLGAATTTTLLILAQVLTALFIDRLGLFGLEVKLIDINKIIGTFFMLGGVYFISR